MKMQKASYSEWQAAANFVCALDDELGFSVMSDKDLGAWVRNAPPLKRVVFGYQVLVDNCCDPNSTTLEFKAEIKDALDVFKAGDK